MFHLRTMHEERAMRLHARASDGHDAVIACEHIAKARCDAPGFLAIRRAIAFARDIPYNHPGLSRGAYVSHPLRIAGWVLLLDNPPDVSMATLALLHNVYEVSTVQISDVTRSFDASVARDIARLTVDRSQQHRAVYQQHYYRGFRRAGRRVCIVKVLDKLDNLFLLCVNPDDAVRASYLQEVEDFVIALAAEYVEECVPYLQALVRQCKIDGHIPLDRLSGRLHAMTA